MTSDDLPAASGIYAIVNRVSGHRYVGQSVNMRQRPTKHLQELRAGTHRTNAARLLQRAWDEFGEDAFEAVVLELVKSDKSSPYGERPDPLSLAKHYYINVISENNPDKHIVKASYQDLVDARAWRQVNVPRE